MNSYLMWPMLEIVIQASSMDVRILWSQDDRGSIGWISFLAACQ